MITKTKGRSKGRENSGDTVALTMKKKITISVLINIDWAIPETIQNAGYYQIT